MFFVEIFPFSVSHILFRKGWVSSKYPTLKFFKHARGSLAGTPIIKFLFTQFLSL